MGVTRRIIQKGNGADRPTPGDEVTIEYTGNLYDESEGKEKDYRGKKCATLQPKLSSTTSYELQNANEMSLNLRFDSSKGRGDFKTQIGVGKVIKGTLDLHDSHICGQRLTYPRLGRRRPGDELRRESYFDNLRVSVSRPGSQRSSALASVHHNVSCLSCKRS